MTKPFVLLTAALLLPSLLAAQSLATPVPSSPQPAASSAATDDEHWDRMTLLDPGTHVSVKSGRGTVRCSNIRVTDEGFSCEFGSFFAPRQYVDLSRSEVLEVRVRQDRRNFWIGVGAAAAAGFAIGATGSNPGNSQSRLGNGMLGAALFGFVSPPFVVAITHWLPGHSIYRRNAFGALLSHGAN